MVKNCRSCGNPIAISGDYHRANARKYCEECRKKRMAYSRWKYDWADRSDKRKLHRTTKQALAAAEETISRLMEYNNLLEQRNIQLKRELAEYAGV